MDDSEFPIIRVKSMPVPKKFGLSLPMPKIDRKFQKLLKTLNIDIVHVHTVYSLSTFMIDFAKKNNIPVLITAHSKFNLEIPSTINLPIITKHLIKRAFNVLNKTDMVLAVSNSTKITCEENNVKVPIKVLNNATEFTYSNKEVAYNFIKDKHNIDLNEENILICVCRIVITVKNLKFLLKSLKCLKDLNVNFKLLMVGSGPDEAKFIQLIDKYQLTENIIMVGKITDREILKYYYLRSDLLVFPSIMDTYAIVKLEAASQKTPLLALENTGTSENIIDNVNGFLSKNNEEECAKKIKEILNYKNKLLEVSENEYKTLAITWDEICDQHIEVYKNLIKNKK